MIKWQPKYEIGIEIIDIQHKRLFGILEEAEQLLWFFSFRTNQLQQMIQLIDELKDYAGFHFAAEEKILRAIDYKRYFEHCVSHGDFTQRLNAINWSEVSQNQTGELYKWINELSEWLVAHVLEDDQEWGRCYRLKNK